MNIKSVVFLLFLGLSACENKPDDLNIESYPMNPGSEWSYNRQVIIKKYASEISEDIVDTDTVNSTIKVWIEKDTLFNDTLLATVFRSQGDDFNWISSQYKYIDPEGLKTYAYTNAGPMIFAKKSAPEKEFPIYKGMQKNIFVNNQLFIERDPPLDLLLPLKDNSSWIYRSSTESRRVQIEKEVSGRENVHVDGKDILCFKIQWNYRFDPTFNGVTIIDWMSEMGLVKRMVEHERRTLSSPEGDIIEGNVQITETLSLISYHIK